MDIGILTYYNVHNHGAVLQANALKSVLEQYGHSVTFLQFDRDYSNLSNGLENKYKLSLRSIPFYAKYLFQRGLRNVFYNISKRKKLTRFKKKNFNIGVRFDQFSGDLVIIGSDEVFSLEIGINPELYGNMLSVDKVISYAASFGPTVISDIANQDTINMIVTGLRSMKAVSVRDRNSQEIVKQLSNIDAQLVCDPVILYGYTKEKDIYIPKKTNYILIYSYDKNFNDKEDYIPIIEYAKKKGLQIFSVGYHHKWCKNINCDPIELLGWIKHADMVITDTFHGSVLSIVCCTNFVVKLRGNQNKLRFLLNEYKLTERIVEDMSMLSSLAEQDINFDEVNEIVKTKRSASINWLRNYIGNE